MSERKTIYLDDAIAALGDKPETWNDTDYELGQVAQWNYDRTAIAKLPSAQPAPDNLHPKVDPNFMSCSYCIHAEDSEEICALRKCVHIISELKECYIQRG